MRSSALCWLLQRHNARLADCNWRTTIVTN